jgi:hypothetical protein
MPMRTQRLNTLHVSRLRPLVACLAIAFSAELLAAPGQDQPDTVLLVQNCDDAGANSLRDTVDTANMVSGDVTIEFDLNAMQCSTITLTSGEIKITNDNLTFQGPGADLLTIDGGYSEGYSNRIFDQPGQGTLTIEGLTLSDAKYASASQSALGGCVLGYSVNLVGSKVHDCSVISTAGNAYGGGIAARYSFAMLDGSISNCKAISGVGSVSGGGIFAGSLAGGSFTAKYSAIVNNTAHTYGQNSTGDGGGIFVGAAQSVLIQRSTISGNHAERGGGLFAHGDVTLSDSTISENVAAMDAGANLGAAVLYNSTIAFNKATELSRTAGVDAQSLQSNSSIFAFNVTDDGSGAVETDVESSDGMVTGADNLIIAPLAGTSLPQNTSHACPRLAPLLENGGSTRTHALLPGSPAIDAGNNAENLDTDQRGSGFDRIVGGAADMGAYEWSADSGDTINKSGFETCE